MDELSPSVESDPNGDTGNPYPGISSPPFETKDQTPFTAIKWDISNEQKISRLIAKGVTVTLRITPYAILIYLFAPDDFKYEAKKHMRYLPWAIKYVVWWLKQNA